MTDQAIDFNEVAARASDQQILLNIVRASHRNPTHYSAISVLRDSRAVGGLGGASGSFPFGRNTLDPFSVSGSLGVSGSLAPSFDVTPLDTKQAASGLYRPVEPDTFVNYWQQGWTKGLLLSLFVDSLTVNQAVIDECELSRSLFKERSDGFHLDNGAYITSVKDGADKFDDVQKVFGCLVGKLRAVEIKKDVAVVEATLPTLDVVKALPDLADKGFEVSERTGGGAGKRLYTIKKPSSKWVMMFDSNRGRSIPAGFGTSQVPPGHGPEPFVGMTMRSVDGMIYYLGEVLHNQRRRGAAREIAHGKGGKKQLLAIYKGGAPNPRKSIVVNFLGEQYSVSRRRSEDDVTLTALSLISQLFAQYREGADLPRTLAVQAVGVR